MLNLFQHLQRRRYVVAKHNNNGVTATANDVSVEDPETSSG
jgi:hypothetical protein